jgi:hypothetical protein
MNDNEPTIEQRIEVLEDAAQNVRQEAIDVAGKLLARTLAYPNYEDDFVALEARYAALTKIANEARTVIDRLLAEALGGKRASASSATRASLKIVPPHRTRTTFPSVCAEPSTLFQGVPPPPPSLVRG